MIPSTHPDQSLHVSGVGTGPGTEHAGQHAHRPLSDDVLQSAEEAVAAEGADDYAGLSRGDYVARTDVRTSRLGANAERGYAMQSAEDAGVSRLTRYVKAEPAKAALMAAGAGALLALLMGRRRGSKAARR